MVSAMIRNSVLLDDMGYVLDTFKEHSLFEGKTMLVTGCAGFLGMNFSHYFYTLLEEGYKLKSLILLDNFMLYKPKWIEDLEKHSKVHIYTFDIIRDDLGNLSGIEDVDYVIHLATIASPTYYRKYPIETMDANVGGLRRLMDFYKFKDLSGFLYFSSSEIYGDPPEHELPIDEDYRGNVATIGPRACYDEAKRYGETLCYYYAQIYDMPLRIVRPFNNYGPGMVLNDRRAPADFAKSILENENIVLHSDGTPSRTFCYVADALVGYLKALVHTEFDYFNIGMFGPEMSIEELAVLYKKIGMELMDYSGEVIGRKSEDEHYLTHNPMRRCPDIGKAMATLEYNPTIQVEEGIRRYLNYLIEEKVAS